MSDSKSNSRTAYSNANWDLYERYRPPYPDGLMQLVNNYHETHGGEWSRMVDIGAGFGIASTLFAPKYKIVHLSDPSAENISKCQTYVPAWLQKHGHGTRTIEVSQCNGEAIHEHIEHGSVDLVICATAAHFMDPDNLARSAAKILRKGGTLAIFTYTSPSFPDQSLSFSHKIMGIICQTLWESLKKGSTNTLNIWERGMQRVYTGHSPLDSFPVPSEYFEDPERIRINNHPGEIVYDGDVWRIMKEEHDKLGLEELQPLTSRVSEAETIRYYETGKDAEAEGCVLTCDEDWVRGFIETVRAPSGSEDEGFKQAIPELERLFAKEVPSGKTTARFPFNIVLVTRK